MLGPVGCQPLAVCSQRSSPSFWALASLTLLKGSCWGSGSVLRRCHYKVIKAEHGHTRVIPAPRRLRQEDHDLQASRVYTMRSCLWGWGMKTSVEETAQWLGPEFPSTIAGRSQLPLTPAPVDPAFIYAHAHTPTQTHTHTHNQK